MGCDRSLIFPLERVGLLGELFSLKGHFVLLFSCISIPYTITGETKHHPDTFVCLGFLHGGGEKNQERPGKEEAYGQFKPLCGLLMIHG